jgi:hypothetical protein
MKKLLIGLTVMASMSSAYADAIDWSDYQSVNLSVSHMKVIDNKDFFDRDLNMEKSQINVDVKDRESDEKYNHLLTASGSDQEVVDVNKFSRFWKTIIPKGKNISISVTNRDFYFFEAVRSLIVGEEIGREYKYEVSLAEFEITTGEVKNGDILSNENIELTLSVKKVKECTAELRDTSRPDSEVFSTKVILTGDEGSFGVSIMGRYHSVEKIKKRMDRLIETDTDMSDLQLASEVDHSYLYIHLDNSISVDHFYGEVICN